MIRRTIFAAATENPRYALTGILWELEENQVRLVATDGRRLAVTQSLATVHGGHSTQGQTHVVPTRQGPRDRVDREVAGREVGLDRVSQRREVDGAAVLERDAPGAVALRERERSASRPASVAAGGGSRVPAGDVDVDDGAPERLVADGASHQPRLLAGEELAGELKHRARSASRARDRTRSARRAHR